MKKLALAKSPSRAGQGSVTQPSAVAERIAMSEPLDVSAEQSHG
jgi:hypothetical protein